MKRILAILFVLFFAICPLAGCVTPGPGGVPTPEQIQVDVFMFSKIVTRISLTEANLSQDDLGLIKNYLLTLRSFFATGDEINFDVARELVKTELPPQCHVYGYTIIDILERYVRASGVNAETDEAIASAIIYAGLSGALEAVEEFTEE